MHLINVNVDVSMLTTLHFVTAFIYIPTLSIHAVKAQASMRIGADSDEPSLLGDAIQVGIEILCTCHSMLYNPYPYIFFHVISRLLSKISYQL